MVEELGESLGRCALLAADADNTDEAEGNSFSDLEDDVLAFILSFLSPSDIAACVRVSRRLRKLCNDDHKVWYPMCERRFGSATDICKWGAGGRVSSKVLHSVLSHFENLVGFWRGVENVRHGSLVVFEWDSCKIVGYRITPARTSTYEVCKVPFVAIGWIGVSHKQRPVCLLDPDWAQLVPGLLDVRSSSASVNGSPGEGRRSTRPLQIPVSPTSPAAKGGSSSSDVECCQKTAVDVLWCTLCRPDEKIGLDLFVAGRVSPFEALGPDWNLEQPTPTGLIVVDIQFVANHHIVMEEYQQAVFTGYPFTGKKNLVEAAAVASFGSCESLCPGGGSPGRHSPASSGGGSEAGRSPPGSFPYEMYHYLAKKVTSPGGERAARKQRRRDRERAFNQGKHLYQPEHFVKIAQLCPTSDQPLRGLWKGIGYSTALDFIFLSYDDQGGIICRTVGDSLGISRSGSIYWTARSGDGFSAPLPESEQEIYNSRLHIHPGIKSEDGFDEELVKVLWATVDMDHYGLNHGVLPNGQARGRVWQYASGRFGFGLAPESRIVDFRPVCVQGHVADVVEIRADVI